MLKFEVSPFIFVFWFLGELKTLVPLDREEQAVYNLLVKATDGGGRFCQAHIVLTLEDVNDNAPEFSADPYTITVFENTEPGTLLTRVQATDADAGMTWKRCFCLQTVHQDLQNLCFKTHPKYSLLNISLTLCILNNSIVLFNSLALKME